MYLHDHDGVDRIRQDLQLVEQQLAAAKEQSEHAELQRRILIDQLLETTGSGVDQQAAHRHEAAADLITSTLSFVLFCCRS